MRIVSQLVPDGKPVSTDIEATRQTGAKKWEITAWGRPLSLGVYPLFISRERSLIHAGTAFCISKIGITVTALHNIHQSFNHRLHFDLFSQMDTTSARYKLQNAGIAIFYHQVFPGGRMSGNLINLDCINGTPPTDIGYIFPQFESRAPYLPLPLSFAVPQIGDRVICIGYEVLSLCDKCMSSDDVRAGRIDLLRAFEHKFHAFEARVTRIFTKRFTEGFIEGPSFTIDTEINQGVCGGPVFSESGHVCGISSSPATHIFGEPASIVSLLHPLLVMNVGFGYRIGSMRVTSNRPLMELIRQGSVITDGSENLLSSRREGEELCLWPGIDKDTADGIYDDLNGFLDGADAAGKSHKSFYSDGYRKQPNDEY